MYDVHIETMNDATHATHRIEHTRRCTFMRQTCEHIMTMIDRTKRIVDTHDANDVATQIDALLSLLRVATTLNERKRIRRKLRTRDYYLSRINTTNTNATMNTNATNVVDATTTNANDANVATNDNATIDATTTNVVATKRKRKR